MGKNKRPHGEKRPKKHQNDKQAKTAKTMEAILLVVAPKLDSIHAQMKARVGQAKWKEVYSIIDNAYHVKDNNCKILKDSKICKIVWNKLNAIHVGNQSKIKESKEIKESEAMATT